jgi:hypothetical protein
LLREWKRLLLAGPWQSLGGKAAKKVGQAQNCGSVREQERRLLVGLLQGLEQAPLRQQEWALLQDLVRAQVQGLLRQPERRLLQYEDRGLFRVRDKHPERAL